MISGDSDPGRVKGGKSCALPKLIPATASVPPSPLLPPEASPVVHCILPWAYWNIANDLCSLVANTHWNVFVCSKVQYVCNTVGKKKINNKIVLSFIYKMYNEEVER